MFTAVDHTHFSVSLDLLGGHIAFGPNRSKALMQYMVVVENVEVSVRNRLFDVLRDEARIKDAQSYPGTNGVKSTQRFVVEDFDFGDSAGHGELAI